MLSWIRSALLENLSLKLFALLLAIILFRRVNQQDLVRVATVDVRLVYAFPKKLMMTSEPVNSIKVTLQGPESKINRVLAGSRGWKFTVGFSDATPGPMQTELYTQEIRSIFPGEIKVTRIKPSILNVRFVERAKRTLPIKIMLKGKPPYGYKLLRPVRPYPPKISIEGPKAVVGKLEHLKTQVIDLSSQKSDETLWVKLESPDKFIRFLSSNVVRVMLQVHILKGNKQFENLPIKVLNFVNPKMEYELHPKNVDITLVGPLSQLHPVKPEEIVIETDVSKIATLPPGEHKVPLKIRPPAPDLKPLKPNRTVTIRTMWRDGMAPDAGPDAGSAPSPSPRKPAPPISPRRRTKPKRRKRRKKRRRRRRRRHKHRRPGKRRHAKRARRKPPRRRSHRRKPPKRQPVRRRPRHRKKAAKRRPAKHKRRLARRKEGHVKTIRTKKGMRVLRVLKHLPAKAPTLRGLTRQPARSKPKRNAPTKRRP